MTVLVTAMIVGWFVAVAPANADPAAPAPDIGIDQRLNEQVPFDLVFRDEDDRPVKLGKYFGDRPVILVLVQYRCPRLCSVVLNGLVESLTKLEYQLGKDFTIVTVSFDAREKPALAAAKKAAYLERYGRPGASIGWHFLTGDAAAIRSLAAAVGFRYTYDRQRDQFAHASGIMVMTAQGRISRYFFGLEYAPRDLQFGLEDASAGTIGSSVTRPLRLLCFEYDPHTGTYSLMTMRLVRLGGAITMMLLGIMLLRAWRRERRSALQPAESEAGLPSPPAPR
jgi:protein SCO1/2